MVLIVAVAVIFTVSIYPGWPALGEVGQALLVVVGILLLAGAWWLIERGNQPPTEN